MLAGGTRYCVACSNAYASAISRGSENAGPENVTVWGNGTAMGGSPGAAMMNPPGTVTLGKPALAGAPAKLFPRARIASVSSPGALDAVRPVVQSVQRVARPHEILSAIFQVPRRVGAARADVECLRANRDRLPVFHRRREGVVERDDLGERAVGRAGCASKVRVQVALESVQQHGRARPVGRSGPHHARAKLRRESVTARIRDGCALRSQHRDRRCRSRPGGLPPTASADDTPRCARPCSALLVEELRVVVEAVAGRQTRARWPDRSDRSRRCTPSRIAASVTVRAIGPAVSWSAVIGMMPSRLTRPTVGLMPTTPFAFAGLRIDPDVSVPIATAARFALTADARARARAAGLQHRPAVVERRRRARGSTPRVVRVEAEAAERAVAGRHADRDEVREFGQRRLAEDDRARLAQLAS